MSEQLLSQSSQPSDLIHIRKMVEQLNADYRAMRSERHRLAQWEEEQNFSILGEIEIFATKIQGYASQIVNQNLRESIDEMIVHLRELKLFNIDYVSDWYFAKGSEYTQIKAYVEAQDYLRLLLLEYLNQRLSLHPVLQ